MAENPIPELLTTEQVAELAGVHRDTIGSMVTRGIMPKAEGQLGNRAFWHRNTIAAWLEARPGGGTAWAQTLPKGNPELVAKILSGWMTMGQVAEMVGTSVQNLAGKVRRGTFLPPAGKIGRAPIWQRSEVEHYLNR